MFCLIFLVFMIVWAAFSIIGNLDQANVYAIATAIFSIAASIEVFSNKFSKK